MNTDSEQTAAESAESEESEDENQENADDGGKPPIVSVVSPVSQVRFIPDVGKGEKEEKVLSFKIFERTHKYERGRSYIVPGFKENQGARYYNYAFINKKFSILHEGKLYDAKSKDIEYLEKCCDFSALDSLEDLFIKLI